MVAGIGHGRAQDGVRRRGQAQGSFVFEGLGDEIGQGTEEGIGHGIWLGPPDRPALGIHDHLPQQRGHGQDPRPAPCPGHERRFEEHRDTPDRGVPRQLPVERS